MKTVTIFFIFLGCYFLYNTSKKASLVNNTLLQKWLQNNKLYAKIIGLTTLVTSVFLASNFFGLSAGIILWLLTVALIFSLVILIAPLQVVNYLFITSLFVLFFLIETFF